MYHTMSQQALRLLTSAVKKEFCQMSGGNVHVVFCSVCRYQLHNCSKFTHEDKVGNTFFLVKIFKMDKD